MVEVPVLGVSVATALLGTAAALVGLLVVALWLGAVQRIVLARGIAGEARLTGTRLREYTGTVAEGDGGVVPAELTRGAAVVDRWLVEELRRSPLLGVGRRWVPMRAGGSAVPFAVHTDDGELSVSPAGSWPALSSPSDGVYYKVKPTDRSPADVRDFEARDRPLWALVRDRFRRYHPGEYHETAAEVLEDTPDGTRQYRQWRVVPEDELTILARPTLLGGVRAGLPNRLLAALPGFTPRYVLTNADREDVARRLRRTAGAAARAGVWLAPLAVLLGVATLFVAGG